MILLKDEANRCLLCKNPKCRQNCPIDTPIPEIISLYKEDKRIEASKILFENNPLSFICSIVCPHEEQCKGNCIRGIKSEPIPFHKIEEELSGEYLNDLEMTSTLNNKDRIAIVGGGPAGITISMILAQRGYKVTLFDAHEKIGGVLRYGIPEYRLKNEVVDLFEDKLVKLGVKIRPNTLIGPVISVDDLLNDGYSAVFVGTGVWNPRKLGIKGETLGHVHYAIDYLKSPNTYRLGKKVAVIGAGNVAMDAAKTAKLNGADVTVVYRKGFDDMPATNYEIEEAKEMGVKFKLFKAPMEIDEDGLIVSDTENIVSEDGRVSTKIIENSKTLFECDSIIIAVSQTPKSNIVSNTTNLDTNKWGLLVTDDNGHTTKDGVFACGDVVTGAKTVVAAVAQAKRVAESIDKYCLAK